MDPVLSALAANPLFAPVSPLDRPELAARGKLRELAAGAELFREGDPAAHLYLIIEGAASVHKGAGSGASHEVARLMAGSTVGELALLGVRERTATVKAATALKLLELPVDAVEELRSRGYTGIMRNVARDAAARLKSSNEATAESLDRALAEAQTRVVMGYFVVAVMTVFTLFTTLLGTVSALERTLGRAEFVTIPLLAAVTIVVGVFMRKTNYPATFFGLHARHAKAQLVEALAVSVPIMIATVAVKLYLLQSGAVVGEGLFRVATVAPNPLLLLGYVLFVPFQELICRGAVQGSMEYFLVGRHKTLIAILLSNGVFFVTHLKSSIPLALIALTLGFLWGWLYHRHRSLLGVSVSHVLIGVWGFEIVGIPGI